MAGAEAVATISVRLSWNLCDWVRATAHCCNMKVRQAAIRTTTVVIRPTLATRA